MKLFVLLAALCLLFAVALAEQAEVRDEEENLAVDEVEAEEEVSRLLGPSCSSCLLSVHRRTKLRKSLSMMHGWDDVPRGVFVERNSIKPSKR